MKNNFILEVVVAAALLALATLVLNPSHMWMPDAVLMGALLGILVLFCLFAVFILRERAADEREASHRMLAGRAAFLSGSLVLVVGIIMEGRTHHVDPWLVLALVCMVVAKLGTSIYSDYRL